MVQPRLLCALLCATILPACLYFEGGGGGAFPTTPSTSTSEGTVSGAVGVTADVRTGPFMRGLRLAGGFGTTHGGFALEEGDASYFTGRYHLRFDQTFWADAPMYLRWMVAAELHGASSWQDARTEESTPLGGSGWALLTGPTLTVGIEGADERELETDGSVHFTLAFHYSRIDTLHGTVALPGVQLRVAFDYNIGGAMAEALRDGMN